MKTIMVDMDDVIVCGLFQKIIEDYLGYSISLNDNVSFYLQDLLGEKKEDFLYKLKNINIYDNANLVEDAYDVLKRINEKYKVYIVTDYIWREIPDYAGINLKNKFDFLYRELDFLTPDRFVFSADKSVINCDIKIDDKLSNLIGASTKLLFTAYHNKSIPKEELINNNVIRVNNWKDIEKVLLEDE